MNLSSNGFFQGASSSQSNKLENKKHICRFPNAVKPLNPNCPSDNYLLLEFFNSCIYSTIPTEMHRSSGLKCMINTEIIQYRVVYDLTLVNTKLTESLLAPL